MNAGPFLLVAVAAIIILLTLAIGLTHLVDEVRARLLRRLGRDRLEPDFADRMSRTP